MPPLLVLLLVLLSLFSNHAEGQRSNLTISVVSPTKYASPKYLKENATNILKIGSVGIVDQGTFGNSLTAIQLAIDWVNNQTEILPDTLIELYYTTGTASQTAAEVLLTTFFLAIDTKVHALIGTTGTQQTKDMQTVCAIYQIPQMCANAITSTLSNKLNYPYFARAVSADSSQIAGIVQFMLSNNWTQGVVIYTTDEYGGGYQALLLAASKQNITLYSQPVAAAQTTPVAAYRQDMDNLKQLSDERGYRIFVLYTSLATNAILQAMNISGFMGPGYVTVITGGPPDGMRNPNGAMYTNPIVSGLFGFGYGQPNGPIYEEFAAWWKSKTTRLQISGTAVNPWYYVDTVWAYARAYDNLMKEGKPFANITGPVFYEKLKTQRFTGVTGEVVLDANGDRLGSFELWNWLSKPGPEGLRHAGHFSVLEQKFTKLDEYVFFNGSTTIPRDRPYRCVACVYGTCVEDVGCVCNAGYSGVTCEVKNKSDKDSTMTIIIAVVVAVVVAGLISGVAFYMYHKNRRVLVRSVAQKQKSIIARSDLVLNGRIGRGASGEVCKGLFRGTEIAVKKIVTSNVSKAIIEDFELEVAVMCGLRHPNIIMFMGSCYDPTTNEMLLCMEYMGRGSLNDVLHNPNMALSYEMKLHLAAQAAQGMNFLHQSTPPTIHRDLKSHNILLDDKWNARISDFGISKFKETTHTARSDETSGHLVGTIYWTAPEVLAGREATEKCDCYAFGIVLWELFHRELPFKGRDPMSVAVEVINNGLRPTIDDSATPPQMQSLMKACWAQNPQDRPSFQEIMTTLRGLSLQAPLQDYGGNVRMDAPTGHVYLVATTIPGAYGLWEAIPRGMEEAVKLHNQVIRHNLDLYKGYEVSFYDHSFKSAFVTMEDAVNFAIAVQVSLLHIDWPKELLAQPLGQEVHGEPQDTLLWKGLRVRMAIGSGVPNCEIDNATNRMKYFGPLMELVMKMLDMSLEGGVLLNDAVAGELTRKSPTFVQEASARKAGTISSQPIHQLVVRSLAGRGKLDSAPKSDGAALPHAVVTMDDLDEETLDYAPNSSSGSIKAPSATAANVKWVAAYSDIEVKDVIGKGPIGDYYRGYWKGKEVCVKQLVNQKLKENDWLKLIGDSAYMSKVQHPNILPFFAVCLEQDKLTILSEYEQKGGLKQYLADSTVVLSFGKKLKLALGIAHGMDYLTSLPDDAMRRHDNLKSSNVLIGRDGEVKVADYGHSNIKELARTMTSVGNVAWTAPEILNGQVGSPLMASYSFGIILWEIYTRQLPYKGEHPIRVVTQILEGFRPVLPSDCPPSYQKLYSQCVDADPEKRPSWSTIINVLNELLASPLAQ